MTPHETKARIRASAGPTLVLIFSNHELSCEDARSELACDFLLSLADKVVGIYNPDQAGLLAGDLKRRKALA